MPANDAKERAELLAWVLDDFVRFCGILDIVGKEGGRQKLVLNEIQRIYCQNRTKRDVVLKGRQVGQTTLELARDVYHFLTVPGARVVVMCQSITDHGPSKRIAKTLRVMFESLERAGLKLKFRKQSGTDWELADRDASLTIEEAGASEAAASKKGRSGTITRLHLTETAFWEYASETLNAVLECVPGPEYGTEIVSESTPNGAAGVFYQQCSGASEGRSGYTFHFFPWFFHTEYALELEPGEQLTPETQRERWLAEIAKLSPEQLKWYRRKVAEKGQDLTDQEYPSDPDTCFLVSGRTFFEQKTTAALLAAAKPPISVEEKGALRIWQHATRGVEYVISVDTSEGLTEGTKAEDADNSAALVFERGTGAHCATLHGKWPTWELARMVAKLGFRFNTAVIAVERNNHGHAVLQALDREQHYPKMFRHDDQKLGWLTNAATRPMMLDAFEDAHRRGVFKTNDVLMLKEMRTFVVTDTGRAEGAKGEHDDLVMGGAIGWSVICRPVVRRDYSNLPPR